MKQNKKEIKNNQQQKGRYGILSMMAMIIGIVIGSGIFIQNANLMGVNNSPIISIIGWLIGSLIVLFMMIAFLEIFSITEITNEQSTIGNWGKHLINVNFGKVMGIYFTYVYFPAASALTVAFGAEQILAGFSFIDPSTISPSEYLGYIIAIAGIILILVSAMNATSATLGKYFQNIGTAIKLLPIIFSILLLFIVLITNVSNIDFNQSDPTSTISSGTISLIFMTIPFVLFSFDGFIFAGSLSKEGKTKNTFRNASIASILLIIFFYVSFTVVVFGLGDATDKTHPYGSITNVIYNNFSLATAQWLAPTVNAIIVVSILTGVSGQMIASSRMSSDLSTTNTIKDAKSEQIKRNKYGVASTSVFTIILFIIQWFLIFAIFDAIYVTYGLDGSNPLLPGSDPLIAQLQISNLLVIIGFVFYSVVIIAGLVNRITNKVQVKKSSMFIPSAIISSISALLAAGYFTYLTFIPSAGESLTSVSYLIKSIVSLIFIFEFLGLSLFHIINSKKLTQEENENKYEAAVEYYYGDVPINITPKGYISEKTTKKEKIGENNSLKYKDSKIVKDKSKIKIKQKLTLFFHKIKSKKRKIFKSKVKKESKEKTVKIKKP